MGNNFTLLHIIESLATRELKSVAYSYFSKYPVENFFHIDEVQIDDLLKNEYIISIDGEDVDATNLAIVQLNEGYIFTAALHQDVEKDLLQIHSHTACSLSISNLYGVNSNTSYIEQIILQNNAAKETIMVQIEKALKKSVMSSAFERDFKRLTLVEQQSILNAFYAAIARNLSSPLYPDTKHISDVSPQHSKCVVYELRIYTPTAIRVYFNESAECVYLASIQKKSNPDQNQDIKKAHNKLRKMIVTNK